MSDQDGADADRAVGRRDPPLAAVILAGGRGSRLGGVDKTRLYVTGPDHGRRRLLDRVLDAVAAADVVVVVGPVEPPGQPAPTSARVRVVREDPPFSGPAAATAAGVAALSAGRGMHDGRIPDGWVLLLCCDLVHPAPAVAALLDVVRTVDDDPSVDAVTGTDPSGRRQPLTAAYRTAALAAAVSRAGDSGLVNASMRELVDGLRTVEAALTRDESADVDTVEDARRHGVRGFPRPDEEER